jgi:hypothetical protein
LLDQAKVGILATVLIAPVLSTVVVRAARGGTGRLRPRVDCGALSMPAAVTR